MNYMVLLNMWLYILGFLVICFILVIILANTAPEYIEDNHGNLIPKDEYEEPKNQSKKK